jgi:hypothetical protein
MMARLTGWRTVIINGLMAAGVVLGEILQFLVGFDWAAVFSPRQAVLIVLGVNVANIILRSITTTAIGKAS